MEEKCVFFDVKGEFAFRGRKNYVVSDCFDLDGLHTTLKIVPYISYPVIISQR